MVVSMRRPSQIPERRPPLLVEIAADVALGSGVKRSSVTCRLLY
jgi:hypothetical protein